MGTLLSGLPVRIQCVQKSLQPVDLCPPQNVSTNPSTSEMTVFGKGVFTEVIKLKQNHLGVPLYKGRDLDRGTDRRRGKAV